MAITIIWYDLQVSLNIWWMFILLWLKKRDCQISRNSLFVTIPSPKLTYPLENQWWGDEISFWDGLLLGAMSQKKIHLAILCNPFGILKWPFLVGDICLGNQIGSRLESPDIPSHSKKLPHDPFVRENSYWHCCSSRYRWFLAKV